MPRFPSPAFGTVVLAALLLTSTTAEAQLLGRLQKAVSDRAADAVGRSDGSSARSSERVPITAERLEQFITAMRPALTQAGRLRELRAARKRHEEATAVVAAHNGRVEACAARVMEQERPRLQRLAANPVANQEALQRLQGYDPALGPLAVAMSAAANRNDQQRMQVLEDSMTVIKFRAITSVVPGLTACGVPRSRPPEPVSGEATAPESLIVPPAGMTRAQFGLLRERVALYVLTEAREGAFTGPERAVLDARAAELQAMAPFFRDGLLEWSQWGGESELARAWNAGRRGS